MFWGCNLFYLFMKKKHFFTENVGLAITQPVRFLCTSIICSLGCPVMSPESGIIILKRRSNRLCQVPVLWSDVSSSADGGGPGVVRSPGVSLLTPASHLDIFINKIDCVLVTIASGH